MVLMVCPQFRPIMGGYERAAERVAGMLAAQGHHVDVVTERRSRAWPISEDCDGVRVYRLPCLYKRGVHTLTVLLSLAAFLLKRRGRYDVAHIHQYGATAALVIALAGLCGYRTVLKLTSTGVQGIGAELLGWRFLASLSVRLHRRVDACIALSLAGRDEAVAFGIPVERVHIIPNGLDVDAFRPLRPSARADARGRLSLPRSAVVLFVARLTPAKEPLALLAAWALVVLAHPAALLLIVGDGPELEAMERYVESHGLRNVRFEGQTDAPLPYYQASDIYVSSSSREGLSNSLLEALSCALPVVATRVSGSTDVFSRADVGVLVDVGHVPGLADGICALLSDPERRFRCGRAARALAEQSFALSSVVAQIASLYRASLRAPVPPEASS